MGFCVPDNRGGQDCRFPPRRDRVRVGQGQSLCLHPQRDRPSKPPLHFAQESARYNPHRAGRFGRAVVRSAQGTAQRRRDQTLRPFPDDRQPQGRRLRLPPQPRLRAPGAGLEAGFGCAGTDAHQRRLDAGTGDSRQGVRTEGIRAVYAAAAGGAQLPPAERAAGAVFTARRRVHGCGELSEDAACAPGKRRNRRPAPCGTGAVRLEYARSLHCSRSRFNRHRARQCRRRQNTRSRYDAHADKNGFENREEGRLEAVFRDRLQIDGVHGISGRYLQRAHYAVLRAPLQGRECGQQAPEVPRRRT